MKVYEHLQKSIQDAAIYNPEIQSAPVCILWPDRDHQWEAVIPVLQAELPELMILGDYYPEKKSGPAIWLRCIVADQVPGFTLPKERIPILYLPGVSRQDLRAIESCPDNLKPLAELQYRGVIWSQINSKDWTIMAYLKSDQGGLGLDVAQDSDAKNAMQLALNHLLDEDVSLLKGKRLDKDFFNTLLTGGDPIRDLLQWLDQEDAFKTIRSENEWKAFDDVCRSLFAFSPQKDGILVGSSHLANHQGPWHTVWERYCEAPKRYPNIPSQIRKNKPPFFDLFADEVSVGGWPQWNESKEEELKRDLSALEKIPPHEARLKILDLEKHHGSRRSLVWAELGEAPLACTLQYLVLIAEITKTGLAAGSIQDLARGYQNSGWKADDAVIRALALLDHISDLEVVTIAIRSLYLPWIEESARYLQKVVDDSAYPGGTCLSGNKTSFQSGDCILFVDGLRFDTSKRLATVLESRGLDCSGKPVWGALPSVTSTGKPAVTPVTEKIRGIDGSSDFEPAVAETGQSLKGGYHLKKLIIDEGWHFLDRSSNGDGTGMAWCEFGDIDHEGHDRGWKLSKQIDVLIKDISDRIRDLLDSGWKRIHVVTDHGWLLMPGGLPKIELPSTLAENKWGRCASLKPGASTEERLYPWFWNPSHFFALADGVSCFKKGEEYTHGGLSLQECLTLHLIATRSESSRSGHPVQFTDVVWKGLRCTVAVDGNFEGLSLDIRTQAGDESSSVVVGIKQLKDNGTASVVIEDEDREGQNAFAVLVDGSGALITQIATVIGGADI